MQSSGCHRLKSSSSWSMPVEAVDSMEAVCRSRCLLQSPHSHLAGVCRSLCLLLLVLGIHLAVVCCSASLRRGRSTSARCLLVQVACSDVCGGRWWRWQQLWWWVEVRVRHIDRWWVECCCETRNVHTNTDTWRCRSSPVMQHQFTPCTAPVQLFDGELAQIIGLRSSFVIAQL